MIQISKDVIVKLDRMKVLNKKLSGETITPDKILKEYHKVQKDMVNEFMPLMEMLAKSGLLTVSIDDDLEGENHLAEKYSNVSGDAEVVFENGNICLLAKGISAAEYRHQPNKK